MRLEQLFTVFHNLLKIGSKVAGRYPHKSTQDEVCLQRPILRLVYLKQENAYSQMHMDSNCLKNLAAKFFKFRNKLSDNDL